MRNYQFHVPPIATELQVQGKDENLLFTICRNKNSFVYLDVIMADGSKKERLSIDEILDLMPEATTDDLKAFASMIYLYGMGWK
jgi:hypothetical protein